MLLELTQEQIEELERLSRSACPDEDDGSDSTKFLYNLHDVFYKAREGQSNVQSNWQPITTAPTDTWVEVIGEAGMVGEPRHFLALARHMPGWRPPEPWRDRQLDALSDRGWTPLYWRPVQPVPDVNAPLPAPTSISLSPGTYSGTLNISPDGKVHLILPDGQIFDMGKLP